MAALDERLTEVIAFCRDFPERIDISVEEANLPTPHLYVSYLAAWSEGPKTIQQWKKKFRNLPHITHSHQHTPLIFTTDGQKLIKDERVASRVNLERGRILTSVAFLNKGTRILSGYDNGSISIWDTTTGALHAHLEVDEQRPTIQNSTTTMTGFDDCVLVWNAVRGDNYKSFWSIAASPDSTKIRSESVDGEVYLWGLVSGKWQLVSWFDSRDPGVQGSASQSPNGAYLINRINRAVNIYIGPASLFPPLKDVLSVAICQRGTRLQVAYGHDTNKLVCLEHINNNNVRISDHTLHLLFKNSG